MIKEIKMAKGTGTVTISYPLDETNLIKWVEGQANKKHLKLGSFSAVVRACIKIVRDKDLISG